MAKETRILIVHGWSDCSKSFVTLKLYLVSLGIGEVESVFYVDYESREDNMTYEDIIEGLNNQLIERRLVRNDGTSDYDLKIIVHSTGGLVVRHWLWRYYFHTRRMEKDKCPVTNLVMLAPANFGSPLAQMGKSFIGGLVKGRWKVGDLLETGKRILHGLELGSAYQWKLAHRDLIEANYFTGATVRTTVLVGNRDYKGIRGWLNKPGTDGTVVIAGTNLNTVKLCLKFATPHSLTELYKPHQWDTTTPASQIAFAVLNNYDHGSIVDEAGIASLSSSAVSNVLVRALQVDEAGFEVFQQELLAITSATYSNDNVDHYQQFLVHAVDYQEQAALDFTLDFAVFEKKRFKDGQVVVDPDQTENDAQGESQSDAEYQYSLEVNDLINKDAHTYSQDSSYRRFLVNTDALFAKIAEMNADHAFADGYGIFMKVFVPAIDENIDYYTKNLENVLIYDSTGEDKNTIQFFFPNTTTLIELQVDRMNKNVWIDTEPRDH